MFSEVWYTFSSIAGSFLELFWPVIVLAILFPLSYSMWLHWRQERWKKLYMKSILLELRIPREIKKSPQAMEQVLTALHTLKNTASDIKEKHWDGEVTRWFSLEIVSFGGEIHFYIRTYWKQRGLVEAAFFSYYPDVEIVEVEDYVDRLPANIRELYGQGYDLWGSEMVLSKDPFYPIKTYKDFEAIAEEKEFDPVSVFLEVLGKLKQEEIVGIQILIGPGAAKWNVKWEEHLDKLKEPRMKESKKSGADGQLESFAKMIARSPGETDVLKAIENNLSKPAFDTQIRFIYLSPKTIYYDSFARRGLVGAFNQYAALDLNSFRQNYPMSTRTRFWNFPFLFPSWRNEYRKQRLLYSYRGRKIPPKTFMGKLTTSFIFNSGFSSKRFLMNTECLATIFHPPTFLSVTAPHIKRVESRKTGPPAGLPIYGDEGALDRFQ